MPKKKKTARAKAKDKAWTNFSIYIRTRDCIRFRDSLDTGMCVTCKRDYPFKQLQAGHFIQGRGNAVLFDERLVYSQCGGCNMNPPHGKGGNLVEFTRFMLDEVGLEKIDEFRALKHETVPYKQFQFEEIAQTFADKTAQLIYNYNANRSNKGL